MTDDHVLHALIDLVQAIEEERHPIDGLAYQNALKVIRQNVNPGGDYLCAAGEGEGGGVRSAANERT